MAYEELGLGLLKVQRYSFNHKELPPEIWTNQVIVLLNNSIFNCSI